MDARAKEMGTLGKTIRVACSNVDYLVRCECKMLYGRIAYRGQCHIHGPAQPAVYVLPFPLAAVP